jgi:hypothetical protein
MKVFVYGFWSGFVEKKDPVNVDFFLSLFSKVFNEECIVGSAEDSDILLESVFSSNTLLKYKNWKYTFFFSGESTQRVHNFCSKERLDTLSLYSCVLSGERNHKNVINVPLFIPYIYCNNFIDRMENPERKTTVPEKDICVIVSNSGAEDRNKFFDELDKKCKVDYAGNYKNNVPRISADYNTKEFIEFVSNYKFIISMDNSKDDTYITEKITHGFLSGNIPVYWGSDYVCDYFNKDRFINVENTSNEQIEKTIDKIQLLLNNPEEYIKMVNNNIFPNIDNKLSRTLDDIAKDIQNTIFDRKFKLIEKTYVITSPIFEPERYKHINDVFLNKLGLKEYNTEFHCPTYKTTIDRELLKDKIPHSLLESTLKSSKRRAEISLFINHISALKDILKKYKDGYFLVCESDVNSNEHTAKFNDLLTVLDNNKDKWEVISIGTPYSEWMFKEYFNEDFTNESDNIRLIRKKGARCTDSFIWSYSGIKNYLNIVENDIDYELQYDHYMIYIFNKYFDDKLRFYWSKPSFIIQESFNDMKTTIF